MLIEINPGLIITPSSKKSGPMVSEAVQAASRELGKKMQLITLYGGKDVKAVKREVRPDARPGDRGYMVSYYPITSQDEPKYLGITPDDAWTVLCEYAEKDGNVAIVDDVYSMGATMKAARKLVGSASFLKDLQPKDIPVLVVAREVAQGDTAPAPGVFEAIILPVIVGQLGK